MLEITDLVVAYGNRRVLDGLTWTVGDDDRLVAVALGPSGCGKSTLLRAIAGLEPLVSGRISFDGADLSSVPPHRRDFGVVFQDGQLFTGRSVAANVAYGLRMRRWPKASIADRVDEVLELVDLAALARQPVEQLSGGQAQRVALARALAPRPRLLLLDEPLAALDRQLRERLVVDIADIVRATSTPTVMVTHDHGEAAVMADEIGVLRAGKLVQTATPQRLWRAPVDEPTARFLGCTTVIEARRVQGRWQTPLGPVDLPVPDGAGERLRLGLRPESMRVSVAADDDDDDADAARPDAPAEVVAAVALPDGTRVRVRTAVGEVDGYLDESVSGSARSLVGAAVSLRLVADRLAVIDG